MLSLQCRERTPRTIAVEVAGLATSRVGRRLLKGELRDIRCFSPLLFAHIIIGYHTAAEELYSYYY